MRKAWMVVGAALLAINSTTLEAQKASVKELVMSASNLTAKEQATASKKPADSARKMLPGDVVEYRMVFTNTKGKTMHDVTFNNAIPRALAYTPGSGSADRADVEVTYSIDNGKTFSAIPMIEVTEAGQKIRRPAPPEMYTHVQWRIPGTVAPSAKVVARYTARVKGPAGTAPSR